MGTCKRSRGLDTWSCQLVHSHQNTIERSDFTILNFENFRIPVRKQTFRPYVPCHFSFTTELCTIIMSGILTTQSQRHQDRWYYGPAVHTVSHKKKKQHSPQYWCSNMKRRTERTGAQQFVNGFHKIDPRK